MVRALLSITVVAMKKILAFFSVCTIVSTNILTPLFASDTLAPKTSLGAEAANTQVATTNIDPNMDYLTGQVLVKFKAGSMNLGGANQSLQISNFAQSKGFTLEKDMPKGDIALLKTTWGETVEQAINRLKSDSSVEYAQPNYQYYPRVYSGSNDTSFNKLWGLKNVGQTVDGVTWTAGADIDWLDAITIFSGATASGASSTGVLVADLDTGVAYNQPDLINQMWDGADCKDENGNFLGGCLYGYDYADGDKDPLPTTSSHGTHIAGTIAAQMNNSFGLVGVNPNAKIMAIKTSLTSENILLAIQFAAQNGADIINASWGAGASNCSDIYNNIHDRAIYDAIKAFPGLFVAAAGNGAVEHDGSTYFDFPSDFGENTSCWTGLDNVISVAATDPSDNLASFSEYGSGFVDIGAPGVKIYSTIADTTSISESFDSLTFPALPATWQTGGVDNKWNSYDMGDTVWKWVLYADSRLPYSDSAETTMTTPAIDLTTGTAATINFYAGCDTPYTASGSWTDYMKAEYSSDGVNFSPIVNQYTGNELKWDEATIDRVYGRPDDSTGTALAYFWEIKIPDSFRTANFKLKFTWVTDATDNNYRGCMIDDVKALTFSDGSDEKYAYYDGTSMAAPHVVGLASLAWSYRPDLSYLDIKNAILNNGDSLASLSGKTITGKRINAYKTLASLANPKVLTLSGFTNASMTTEIPNNSLALAAPYIAWTAPDNQGNIASYNVSIDYFTGYTLSGAQIPAGNYYSGSTASGFLNTFSPTNNGTYQIAVRGVNDMGAIGDWTTYIVKFDTLAPRISNKTVSSVTATGATVQFRLSEENASSGSGYVIAYTGWNVANSTETGALNISFNSGSGTATAVFDSLDPSTVYGYLISLSDEIGNIGTSTGSFITASAPVNLDGNAIHGTGATTLTGGVISTGAILDLSGSNLLIEWNPIAEDFLSGSLSISGTNIAVVGEGAWNGIILPPTIIDASALGAATGSEIGTGGATVVQTVQIGADGASLIPSGWVGYFTVSFAMPWYAQWSTFKLYRSDTGATWTPVYPDATCTLDANSMCTFRTDHLSYFAPTFDSTPDAFSFYDLTNRDLSRAYESAAITITGINTGALVTVVWGEYKIGDGAYKNTAGTIGNGQTITLRLTTANTINTPTTATLTIGGVSANFSVTTKATSDGSSSGGSGGGSGGGSSSVAKRDNCPNGDKTASYYDGKCEIVSAKPALPGTISTRTEDYVPSDTTVTTTSTGSVAFPFSDITRSFARDYITKLSEKGVVHGYDDGTFQPNRVVSRAEFLSMAMKNAAIAVDAKATTTFTDIPSDGAWMIPYVAKAKELWIISGQTINGKFVFRPNDGVTRAEAIAILFRASKIEVDAKATTTFTDIPSDGAWMIPYVAKAKELWIISGQTINGKFVFRPNDGITRAESSKIIVKTSEL